MQDRKNKILVGSLVILFGFGAAPFAYGQERTTTSRDSNETVEKESSASESDRARRAKARYRRARNSRSVDGRRRIEMMRGRESQGSSRGRGTRVVTEEDRDPYVKGRRRIDAMSGRDRDRGSSRGGRGTNVVTEEDRARMQNERLENALRRIEKLEYRVRVLENARANK